MRIIFVLIMAVFVVGCDDRERRRDVDIDHRVLKVKCTTDDGNQHDSVFYCDSFVLENEGDYIKFVGYGADGKQTSAIIGKLPHQVIYVTPNPWCQVRVCESCGDDQHKSLVFDHEKE